VSDDSMKMIRLAVLKISARKTANEAHGKYRSRVP
jgi:hypothetical protein